MGGEHMSEAPETDRRSHERRREGPQPLDDLVDRRLPVPVQRLSVRCLNGSRREGRASGRFRETPPHLKKAGSRVAELDHHRRDQDEATGRRPVGRKFRSSWRKSLSAAGALTAAFAISVSMAIAKHRPSPATDLSSGLRVDTTRPTAHRFGRANAEH